MIKKLQIVIYPIFFLLSLTAQLNATTIFVLPDNSLSSAIGKLRPGDTLILKNGTYKEGTSGLININCSSNARNGTATKPITIRAENERQAFLYSDGNSSALWMRYCSYWNIVGLHARSRDYANSDHEVFYVRDSQHINMSRLLLTHNNRYYNTALLQIWGSSQITVEESEFYHFHRHAIGNWESTNNVYRRNYFNSRFHADIPNGKVSGHKDRGEKGIALYPCRGCLVENNISENNGGLTEINATFNLDILAKDNSFFGNISLNDINGAYPSSRGEDLNHMPQNTTFTNFIAINSVHHGLFTRTAKNTQCINCTFINGLQGVNANLQASGVGDGKPTTFITNSLAVGNKDYGFRFTNQSSFDVTYSNAYNNGVNYSPKGDYSNATSIDPSLGNCKIFIPKNSPMKGAGKNGADIGANILYQYNNSKLTATPLWDTAIDKGRFTGCGAIIAGVNDLLGTSCQDVHRRLNVNHNGCQLPDTYPNGDTTKLPITAPERLKIIN